VHSVHAIAIPEQKLRCLVPRESLDNLLSRPFCRRVLGDVEVDDSSAIGREDDEYEQDPEAHGRYGEEVDRDEIPSVILQEGHPGR
jgi:hypothetical protein